MKLIRELLDAVCRLTPSPKRRKRETDRGEENEGTSDPRTVAETEEPRGELISSPDEKQKVAGGSSVKKLRSPPALTDDPPYRAAIQNPNRFSWIYAIARVARRNAISEARAHDTLRKKRNACRAVTNAEWGGPPASPCTGVKDDSRPEKKESVRAPNPHPSARRSPHSSSIVPIWENTFLRPYSAPSKHPRNFGHDLEPVVFIIHVETTGLHCAFDTLEDYKTLKRDTKYLALVITLRK
ncbi:hypothetical protein KM043_002575 [Ampulex compressa]|nr:hypothetical protein KM043_002575 [Ampulex compressa]